MFSPRFLISRKLWEVATPAHSFASHDEPPKKEDPEIMTRRPMAATGRALIRPIHDAQYPLLSVPVLTEHFTPEQLLRAANAGATFYDAGGLLMGDYSAISLLTEADARSPTEAA